LPESLKYQKFQPALLMEAADKRWVAVQSGRLGHCRNNRPVFPSGSQLSAYENMAAFFEAQLDFIFFFYGLAFILLGTVCFSIARIRTDERSWIVLGLFALVHGTSEWLDLTALIAGDTPLFAIIRISIMTASFVLLMEFARLQAVQFGMKVPGRWIYLPLLTIVILGGADSGLSTAGALARYIFGFFGAIAAGLAFVSHAREFSGTARRLALFTAVGFVLYGIAAGAIVPAAPFWPASVLNHGWFAQATGMPIQLLRGTLACALAFSVWVIWGQLLVAEVSSERYTAHLRRQFIWTVVVMIAVLVLGWTLTEFLGGIYRQNIQREAQGDIGLLASRLAGETSTVNGMVKALAGSPSIAPLLSGADRQEIRRGRLVLDLDVEASGATLGIILDKSGAIVASTDHDKAVESQRDRVVPWFQKSIAGEAAYYFAYDPANKGRYYYASYPVRSDAGDVIGVAVLQKSLDGFEADLREFGRPYFLVNPDGVVVLTNRSDMLLRQLWPLPAETRSALVDREVTDAQWTSIDGKREYVRRHFADHSRWSLVIVMPTGSIFASRILGIIITLMVTIMSLIYFVGREHGIRESVQMDKRLELQELARDLRFQATTDPLTGLYNRLKFDEALASELSRAKRYGTPLALILYDVDHFKRINDTYGHQVGDNALVQLSQIVSMQIRTTDLLARWGGEEFVILAPGSDGEMARQAADKLAAAIERTTFDGVGTITCSFGITQHTDGDSADTLIARADLALYRAKTSGRNRVELAPMPDAVINVASVA
jgi:diguanylate cyclase (GGDEF)-like protein